MPRVKRPRTHRLDWIDSGNARQVSWAVSYLISGHYLREGTYPHEYALRALSGVTQAWPLTGPDAPRWDLVENKMRAAWRSRRYDDRHKGEKVYGFRMSKEVGSKLAQLTSRGVSIGQAVEDLINGGLEQARRIRELQLENKRLRFPLARQDGLDPLRSRNMISRLKDKNQELAATAKEWQSLCESLAHDLARHKVAQRAQGASEAGQRLSLPPEEEAKADRLQRQWMKAYEAKVKHVVKAELGKMALEAAETSTINSGPLLKSAALEIPVSHTAPSATADPAPLVAGDPPATISALPPATNDTADITAAASATASKADSASRDGLPIMPYMSPAEPSEKGGPYPAPPSAYD